MGVLEIGSNVSMMVSFGKGNSYMKYHFSYTKPKGQLPDYSSPVVLQIEKTSITDFCNKLHRSIAKEFKYALVWGSSVKHQPQKVGIEHVLNDEDVVQIVKKV